MYRVVYCFDTGSLAGIGIDIIYWYWSVGISVGILSTREFGGNSLTLSRRHSQKSFVINVRLVDLLLVKSVRRKSHTAHL